MLTLDEFKADDDWRCAFQEAVNGEYVSEWFREGDPHVIDNVTEVHHAAEGENDGDEWVAIVSWSGPEGDYAVMAAGCDYTGWD